MCTLGPAHDVIESIVCNPGPISNRPPATSLHFPPCPFNAVSDVLSASPVQCSRQPTRIQRPSAIRLLELSVLADASLNRSLEKVGYVWGRQRLVQAKALASSGPAKTTPFLPSHQRLFSHLFRVLLAFLSLLHHCSSPAPSSPHDLLFPAARPPASLSVSCSFSLNRIAHFPRTCNSSPRVPSLLATNTPPTQHDHRHPCLHQPRSHHTP